MKRFLTLFFVIILNWGYAQTENKLALVIGNSNYVGKGNSLNNPINDAKEVSKKLKNLGFDVKTLQDASLLQMDDAISDLGNDARNYDVVMFYYSGHGIQSNKGENYMIPVDAELKSGAEVPYKCTAVNLLIEKLEESQCPLKIIVLDACRNNPFENSWHKSLSSSGLSAMNVPYGTIIAYATSPGHTANDGDGKNSPYTTAFLKTLEIPNNRILDFFNDVNIYVQQSTNNNQIPWVSNTAIDGDFCFNTNKNYEEHTTPQQQIVLHKASSSSYRYYRKGKDYYDKRMYTKALKWFRKAANKGNADAFFYMGEMYDGYHYGIDSNCDKAVECYTEAAKLGNHNAQNSLGHLYYYGDFNCKNISKNYYLAAKWYEQAAEQGDSYAQNSLGYMYKNGIGVPKDHSKAFSLFKKAADQENQYAQYNLGLMYYYGQFVSQDYFEAFRWFKKAAEHGDDDAENQLGIMYEYGLGVSQDYSEAIKWYKKSYTYIAKYNLGKMYYDGKGVEQDYYEALKLFRTAAENDVANAQVQLGYMYDQGVVVNQDYSEAIKWFQKAAEQNNSIAQYDLGVMYENGRGVTKDISKALNWYKKAAEQGYEKAQKKVEELSK